MSQSMHLACPICQSDLTYERIDDATHVYTIGPDRKAKLVSDESQGSTTITCSKNDEHKIPSDMFELAMALVEDQE